MIRRTILLELHPARRAQRDALGAEILALLRSRPMVAAAEVACREPSPVPGSSGWDLAVFVDLEDAAALEAYGADRPHAAFVRTRLAPLVAARQAVELVLLDTPD